MPADSRFVFQRWLMQARRDLKAAEALREVGAYEWAVFLAHQATERVLKGFLYFKGETKYVGHSIRSLVYKCRNFSPSFEVAHDVGRLDDFYSAPRFPDSFTEDVPADAVTPEDAEMSVELARVAVEVVDRVAGEGK